MSHKITLRKNKLAVRVTINRQTTFLFLPPVVVSEHWSKDADFPLPSHPKFKSLVKYLHEMNELLDEVMNQVYSNRMTTDGAKELLRQRMLGKNDRNTLQSFGATMIDAFMRKNEPNNARWYQIAIDQFIKWHKKDIHLSDINYQLLLKFKEAKEQDGLKPNSINNYLRGIRAIYREAQRQEVFETTFKYPFQVGLLPSQQRTSPRNINIDGVKKLEMATFSGPIQKAIDLWLAGFYLQGADFIDIANLTRFNIQGQYVVFNRSKTGQPVRVKLTGKLTERFNRHWDGKSMYIFSILAAPIKSSLDLELYQRKLRSQNLYIRKAAKQLNIEAQLTSKWLRHSWITIAKRMYIDEDIRRQAVGHRNLLGAHSVYSDDFRQDIIDAANRLVIGEINRNEYDIALSRPTEIMGAKM